MTIGTVVVLGDIGRSPRMQYHCMSLASSGVDVNIIAYKGKQCCFEVESNRKITKYLVDDNVFCKLPRKLFILYAPFKVLYQIIQLLYLLLFKTPHPDFYLVQNPPSIPTLFIVWFVSKLQRCKFFIDWHNFGYTIMGLSLGKNHPLVKISMYIERFFGRLSDGNLCVTNAMKNWLYNEWNITATVLYDRSPASFHQINDKEKHELFQRIQPSLNIAMEDRSTLITSQTDSGDIISRDNRPALLVSSTSWTADEDFHVLLCALQLLDTSYSLEDGIKVVCIVTGIGPLKEYYENLMDSLHLEHIIIKTLWLSYDDYPRLLGAADLGVCLHTSSSGLDLPMKVVDMFGTGLPVCAARFACIDELVKDSINGYVFDDEKQLAEQLRHLLAKFPQDQSELLRLRSGVEMFQKVRWEENWIEHAKPVLL